MSTAESLGLKRPVPYMHERPPELHQHTLGINTPALIYQMLDIVVALLRCSIVNVLHASVHGMAVHRIDCTNLVCTGACH